LRSSAGLIELHVVFVVNNVSQRGNTALHTAALAGKTDVAKILIDAGSNVDAQTQVSYCFSSLILTRGFICCFNKQQQLLLLVSSCNLVIMSQLFYSPVTIFLIKFIAQYHYIVSAGELTVLTV